MALPTGWLTALTTIRTFGVGLAFKYTLDAHAQRNDAARKFALENSTAFLQQQLQERRQTPEQRQNRSVRLYMDTNAA